MNENLVFSDGLNIYASFQSKVAPYVKWILVLLNLLVLSGYVALIVNIPKDSQGDFAILFIVIPLFTGLTLTRFTFWNLWGRESIIINTKSFSYQYDYGILTLNLKTKETNGLSWAIHDEFIDGDQTYVTVNFGTFDEHDLEIHLHTTSLRMNLNSYIKLNDLLHELYTEEDLQQASLN